MGKYVVSFLLVLLFVNGYAFERVTYSVSKPLCVLTFLEAASGTGSVAPSLTSYIRGHISGKDSIVYCRAVADFSGIDFRTSYVFPGYPERRQYPKTVLGMITMAAVRSATIDEFLERVVGILPNDQWLKLKMAFTAAEPIYDRLIYQPYRKEIKKQLAGLNKYGKDTDGIFSRLKQFYGSTWGDDMPFAISIYPVPGDRGTTTATPHSNCLVLAVLTGTTDYANCAAVAIHELCHVLYLEQPMRRQQEQDSWLLSGSSAYKQYAYSFIDEALATACGNGWAYKMLAGYVDTSSWYNDPYIDGYAHAIYPMVEAYVESGKAMDKEFMAKAIALFAQKFPNAIYDYQVLLNRINLYTDADDDKQYQQVNNVLRSYFNISSCAGAYPINDPQALDMISATTNTQLFIVHANNGKNYEALKTKFPQMAGMLPDKEGIVNFLDEKNRPVIVVNVHGIDRLEQAVKQLAFSKNMEPGKVFIPIGR